MGIAYSGGPIVHAVLRRDTTAHLLADLDGALTAAGWVKAAVITNGFKYLITSPQGLQAKVLVQAQGVTVYGYPALTVQVMSANESLQGLAQSLVCGLPSRYQPDYEVVAGCCQVFIAPIGIADGAFIAVPTVGSFHDYSFAAGIPYISVGTGACATPGGNAAPTEVWWSNGQAQYDMDFRCCRFCTNAYSYCLNGTLFVSPAVMNQNGPDNGYTGTLQLYPLTPTYDVDAWWHRDPQTVGYKTGNPLYIDPLIGWQFAVWGQLWDAFMSTALAVLDSVMLSTMVDAAGGTVEARWLAWNHNGSVGQQGGGGTFYGTLYLLIDRPVTTFSRGGNYAY